MVQKHSLGHRRVSRVAGVDYGGGGGGGGEERRNLACSGAGKRFSLCRFFCTSEIGFLLSSLIVGNHGLWLSEFKGWSREKGLLPGGSSVVRDSLAWECLKPTFYFFPVLTLHFQEVGVGWGRGRALRQN